MGNSRAVARLDTVPYTVSPTLRTWGQGEEEEWKEEEWEQEEEEQEEEQEKEEEEDHTWTSCGSPIVAGTSLAPSSTLS